MVKGCVIGCDECERLDKNHTDASRFYINHHWDFTVIALRKMEDAGAELKAHLGWHQSTRKLDLSQR